QWQATKHAFALPQRTSSAECRRRCGQGRSPSAWSSSRSGCTRRSERRRSASTRSTAVDTGSAMSESRIPSPSSTTSRGRRRRRHSSGRQAKRRTYLPQQRFLTRRSGRDSRSRPASSRASVAKRCRRQRRHLAAIRPYGEEVMLLTTMVHADEVLPAEFWMPESGAPPSEKELKMARMLIDALAGPFEPQRFTDEHRERVLKAIEQKKPIESPAAAPSPTRVLDLMAALEASVKAAKAARAKEEKERARPE